MPRVHADELLAMAVEASHLAGDLLLERFRAPAQGVSAKSTPTDLVSDADRDAEALLLDFISAKRPGDGVLSEEGGGAGSSSGLVWVVDPLDGTINFLYGLPVWAVSIAIKDDKGGVVGVVHNPCLGETFTAIRGEGARLNGSPMHVSDQSELSKALIGTGFAYDARAREQQGRKVQRILPIVRDIRRAGSAALDLSSLASGRLDGFFEAPMEEWDKAAGVILIKEAGGVVSELPAPIDLSPGVIAANPELHTKLSELVLE
jgi:myo-inositol-1(or 4)-monophosphatase